MENVEIDWQDRGSSVEQEDAWNVLMEKVEEKKAKECSFLVSTTQVTYQWNKEWFISCLRYIAICALVIELFSLL